MNKSDIIYKMTLDAKISKKQAQEALDSFINTTMDCLKKDDKVIIAGFGTFSIQAKKARIGRNPKTGETVNIPAKKVVKFKVGKELSKAAE